MTRATHEPVLVEEVLLGLAPRPGAHMVDGTVGLGGHARAILEATAPDGRLIGLDVDPSALEHARERLASFGERVTLVQASYRELSRVLDDLGVETVDGVLLDLGVSSLQIDRPERGFRFAAETAETTPLDMRMDPELAGDAAALLAEADEQRLTRIFQEYGELPGSRRLAREIVTTRETSPLETAADLLGCIDRSRVGRGRRHHPATRVFQALRIAVNDELAALEEGLVAAADRLAPGGRIAVLAYHSLEDRRVKHLFRDRERGCLCPPGLPECRCGLQPTLRRVTRRPVRPGEAECARNPRSRSARLRVAERLP